MAILITTTFVALTFLNYRVCRDVRYPPFLASGLWFAILILYDLSPIPVHSIGVLTSLIFVVAVLSFSGGGQLALALSAPEIRTVKNFHRRSSGSPRFKLWLLLASIAFLPIMLSRANELAEQMGLANWLVALRVELTSSDTQAYGILGNASILSYFTTFIYAIELENDRKEKWQYYVSLLISIVYAVLGTGRTPFLLVLVCLMGIAAMRNRLGIRKLFVGAIVFLVAFAVFAVILGKGGDVDFALSENLSSVEESLVQYAIGPIPAFDEVVKRDAPLDFGKNTFLDGLNLVRRVSGSKPASPVQEYVSVPFLTNVYTALQPPFLDFGILGVVLAFGLIGAASSYFYIRAVAGDALNIFCYSLCLFPLALMAFSDQYFSPMLSWLKYLIAAYIYFSFSRSRFHRPLNSGSSRFGRLLIHSSTAVTGSRD